MGELLSCELCCLCIFHRTGCCLCYMFSHLIESGKYFLYFDQVWLSFSWKLGLSLMKLLFKSSKLRNIDFLSYMSILQNQEILIWVNAKILIYWTKIIIVKKTLSTLCYYEIKECLEWLWILKQTRTYFFQLKGTLHFNINLGSKVSLDPP